jgi:hypothetical protein
LVCFSFLLVTLSVGSMSVRSALSAGDRCDSTVALRAGDDGTNDLLVSEVIRTNEVQAGSWRNIPLPDAVPASVGELLMFSADEISKSRRR